MARDWKGTPAVIHVHQKLQDGQTGEFPGLQEPVASVAVFLDTDTMLDIFEKYPPGTHTYGIETEDIDDDA